MFKTIFGKLMWANVAILFVSFFLTGIMLFSMLGRYAVDQKAASLREIAPTIADITVSLQIENNDMFYRKLYLDNLEAISLVSSTHIIVTNANGEVFAKTSRITSTPTRVNEEFMRAPLSGVTTQITGKLGGHF